MAEQDGDSFTGRVLAEDGTILFGHVEGVIVHTLRGSRLQSWTGEFRVTSEEDPTIALHRSLALETSEYGNRTIAVGFYDESRRMLNFSGSPSAAEK
jgi:hypothetical protein